MTTPTRGNSAQSVWTKLVRNSLALLGLMLVMNVLIHVTNAKLESLRNANPGNTAITAAERTAQLDCLTQNIYYEAGHEPFEGKVAVAQVTMNRVDDGRFGKGVCGVVHQRNVVYEKIICQFSWVCETKSRVRPTNSAAYAESETVAKKVLLEEFRLPGLREAKFYHADYVNPGWGLPKISQIGRHIFYKDKA